MGKMGTVGIMGKLQNTQNTQNYPKYPVLTFQLLVGVILSATKDLKVLWALDGLTYREILHFVQNDLQ